MTVPVFALLNPELPRVRRRIARELNLKVGHVPDLIPFEFSLQEQCLIPALVILSARIAGQGDRRVITFAAGMEMMYMAQQIHNRIGDEAQFNLTDTGKKMKLQVLIGDYIYGKFLVYISEAGCLEFLPGLCETVCQMNEGGIMRRGIIEKGNGELLVHLQVIRKETALLLAEACRVGAILGGASAEMVANLYDYGLQLGMAVGCHQAGLDSGLVDNYFEQAQKQLQLLPHSPNRELLEMLTDQVLSSGKRQAGWPSSLAIPETFVAAQY